MIQLLLSFPPSVNHYWGQRGNHRFLGKRGKEFRQEVAEACLDGDIKTMYGRLAVHVALFPPDRRKRDVDNILKPLLDACEHAGCFVDDNQIDELHIIRQEVKKGGACTILILEI
jgi:crossover junction endodeoxyribonuclease RusA